MFDIGWSEMLVLAALTIIVVGPKDLPKVMRTVAGFIRKIRSFSNSFMGSIDQMARDAELEELRKNATINAKTPEQIMKEAVDPDEEMADAFSDYKNNTKADNLMQQMVDDDLKPLESKEAGTDKGEGSTKKATSNAGSNKKTSTPKKTAAKNTTKVTSTKKSAAKAKTKAPSNSGKSAVTKSRSKKTPATRASTKSSKGTKGDKA